MSNCRSCGAPVEFAISQKTGKFMCLDAKPLPNGNVVKVPDDPRDIADKMVVRVLRKDEKPNEATLRYRSHHVSCPQAKQWRR